MYKYLFGPVPSRRLGMSLGVDLVPKKVCSLDCVYCEVGKTTKLTSERKEYIPLKKVTTELEDYFSLNPDPDFITFSGSGEPTLNSMIGRAIDTIKNLRPKIPVAVLTNGTLFSDPEVRAELMKADVVLPSLDAAEDSILTKINKPFAELTAKNYIQGLIDFRKEFKGKIWLEIFILPEYNDSPDHLLALKEAILRIKPDSVQLNTLDRPGAIPGLKPASKDFLEKVKSDWGLDNVEIIAATPERKVVKSYRGDAETAILETIARRPCTLDDLSRILGMHISEINKYLDVLESEGIIKGFHEERGIFYRKLTIQEEL